MFLRLYVVISSLALVVLSTAAFQQAVTRISGRLPSNASTLSMRTARCGS